MVKLTGQKLKWLMLEGERVTSLRLKWQRLNLLHWCLAPVQRESALAVEAASGRRVVFTCSSLCEGATVVQWSAVSGHGAEHRRAVSRDQS